MVLLTAYTHKSHNFFFEIFSKRGNWNRLIVIECEYTHEKYDYDKIRVFALFIWKKITWWNAMAMNFYAILAVGPWNDSTNQRNDKIIINPNDINCSFFRTFLIELKPNS